MIDYTYASGFDYDTVRAYSRQETPAVRTSHQLLSTPQKLLLGAALFLISLSLLLLILQSVPAFDIHSVNVHSTQPLPPSLRAQALEQKVNYSSLFSLSAERLERSLSSHPLVQLAGVSRVRGGLNVALSLRPPDFLAEGKSLDGTQFHLALSGDRIITLEKADYEYYLQEVPSIDISQPLDQKEAQELMKEINGILSTSQSVFSRLTGNISLHIPQYHVSIDVREETSLDRLHTALQLIKIGSGSSDDFSYSRTSEIWYDLSQQSLVEKQYTNRR